MVVCFGQMGRENVDSVWRGGGAKDCRWRVECPDRGNGDWLNYMLVFCCERVRGEGQDSGVYSREANTRRMSETGCEGEGRDEEQNDREGDECDNAQQRG